MNDIGRAQPERSKQRSPLLRGLRLLELLGDGPLAVADAARALGVNRSTAQRLLSELEDAGYVARASGSRSFELRADALRRPGSGRAFDGAEVADGAAPEHEAATGDWGRPLHQALRELRDLAGESTLFAVPATDRMLYAAYFPTDHLVGVRESIGSARPMNASAVGKAYLSALAPGTLDVVLGRLDYHEGTTRAAEGPFQLRDMLTEVHERGYALDVDETFVGGCCVATPVFVNGNILVGAAGLTGPTHRVVDRLDEFGKLLLERIRHIEAR